MARAQLDLQAFLRIPGLHASRRAGSGLEFRDHRPYTPGDDLRRVDWRAAARRDRLIMRQSEAEDRASVLVLLDAGANMGYGRELDHKLRVASTITAMIAVLATRQGDLFSLCIGSDNHVDDRFIRPRADAAVLSAVGHTLASLQASGRCPWPACVTRVGQAAMRRALTVVVTDAYDPGESPDELCARLATLQRAGAPVVLLRVCHPDERTFPWSDKDSLVFIDPLGQRPDVRGMPSQLRTHYLRELAAYEANLHTAATQRGLYVRELLVGAPLALAFQEALSQGRFA